MDDILQQLGYSSRVDAFKRAKLDTERFTKYYERDMHDILMEDTGLSEA